MEGVFYGRDNQLNGGLVMRKNTFLTLSLCGMLCVAVSAQAAPLTNFDTWRGSADLGMWRTEASVSNLKWDGGWGDKLSADWRPYGGITYGLGGHWGLQYVYHGMASDGSYSPSYQPRLNRSFEPHYRSGMGINYKGSTNELNLLYSFKKDSRVALFVGANRVKNELRFSHDWGTKSLEGTRTHLQGGILATAPLGSKVDAYGLVGFGTHGLFQGEAGFAYKMKDDWQANVGYRWFRVKDAFEELNAPCGPHNIGRVGDVKVQGITFGVTHFFGPKTKKVVPQAVTPPVVVNPPAVVTPPAEPQQSEVEKELLAKKNIVLKGVNFDFDKDTLQPQGYAILNQVVDVANKYPQWDFLLVGHTDSIGSDKYNVDLSWRRVKTVQRYLTDKGIAENRLLLDAKGESQPIASNETDEGRAQNRRVEISIE